MRFISLSLPLVIFMSGCATAPTRPALEGAGNTVVAANNIFTSDFLLQMQTTEPGNIFVSPLSLSTAMGMLEAGAAGETKAQIDQVFRYPQTNLYTELGVLRKSASRIMEPISPDAGDVQITSIANSVWLDKRVFLKADYVQTLRDDFDAPPNILDFHTQPDSSRETINNWVEDKTNNRIQNLMTKNNVTEDTKLILVNTVYMTSQWQNIFVESQTKPVSFYTQGTKAEPRELMHHRGTYQRMKVRGGEALKIPYANQTSMIVLRPNGRRGLSSVNAMMRQDTISAVIENLDKSPAALTDLALPKFRLEARYELQQPLEEMGLTSIFKDSADLSGISDAKIVKVQDIIQQVFLDVDEEGTEAAAATFIDVIITVGAPRNTPKPKPFIVDRPFAVLIRDDVTGAIMFAGRITNPETAN